MLLQIGDTLTSRPISPQGQHSCHKAHDKVLIIRHCTFSSPYDGWVVALALLNLHNLVNPKARTAPYEYCEMIDQSQFMSRISRLGFSQVSHTLQRHPFADFGRFLRTNFQCCEATTMLVFEDDERLYRHTIGVSMAFRVLFRRDIVWLEAYVNLPKKSIVLSSAVLHLVPSGSP